MRLGLAMLATALAACGTVHAQGTCSKADAAKAEKAVDQVNNWPQMQKAYQQYRQCDSDKVADVYAESLVRLIVEWKNVDTMVAAMGDPAFKAFVFKHLGMPSAKDDLEMVYSRAKASCPPQHEAFCKDLADAAKAGLGK
jgi:hypothetical protein